MMLPIRCFDATVRHSCVVRRSPEIDRTFLTMCGVRLASGSAVAGRGMATTLSTFSSYNRYLISAINRFSGHRTLAIETNKTDGVLVTTMTNTAFSRADLRSANN